MSDIKTWSATASENNSAAPDGWPEGMARSLVNDSAREMMAGIRRFWDSPEWLEYSYGKTVTSNSQTSVRISNADLRAQFSVGRRVKLTFTSNNPAYAFVLSSAMSSSDTILTLESFDEGASLSQQVYVDLTKVEAYITGGTGGVRISAFTDGESPFYEVPKEKTAVEINNAIVRAAANGKSVHLLSGVYNLEGPIVIDGTTSNSLVKIVGERHKGTTLKVNNGTNANAIQVAAGAENISIENVVIDGNASNQTSGNGIYFASEFAGKVFLNDIFVKDCFEDGIRFQGSNSSNNPYSEISVNNVSVDGTGRHGISFGDITGNAYGVRISNVDIKRFGDNGGSGTADASACGLYLSGSAIVSNVNVLCNSSNLNSAPNGAGIRLEKPGTAGSPPGADKTQISNFNIKMTTNTSLGTMKGLEVGSSDCQISNGRIEVTTAGGTGLNIGLSVKGKGLVATELAKNVLISNVLVTGAEYSEIEEYTSSVSLVGCHFPSTSLTSSSDYALKIIKTQGAISISDCQFGGDTTSGSSVVPSLENGILVDLQGSGIATTETRLSISDCDFSKIDYRAITLAGVSFNTLIKGCRFNDVSRQAQFGGSASAGSAILVGANSQVDRSLVISDCSFFGISNGNGIKTETATYGRTSVIVHSCFFESIDGASTYGVNFHSGTQSFDSVTNCTFANCSGGVRIGALCTKVVASNNVCLNCSTAISDAGTTSIVQNNISAT